MLLIAELLSTSRPNKGHKAPSGFQYLIEGIFISILDAGNSNAVILDYITEDEVSFLGTVTNIHALLIVPTDNVNAGVHMTGINHKTKFLTIALSDSAATVVWVGIYGELITISRTEAIIEWFRKGR